MGGICCGGASYKDEEEKKTESAEGPGSLADRGCTDPLCVVFFIAHWVLFLLVVMMGFSAGNPQKLFMPRDYQGAYCGVEEQWSTGPNLKNVEVQTYTMNVTSTVDIVAKQAVCAQPADDILSQLATAGTDPKFQPTDYSDYLCACCKLPCGSCAAAMDSPTGTGSSVNSQLGGKMTELTSPSAGGLFSPDSANGDLFTNLWADATKYFNPVCSTGCNTPLNSPLTRSYEYAPALDRDYSTAWVALTTSTYIQPLVDATNDFGSDNEKYTNIKSLLASSFTFQALGEDVCPYPASKCVPMPGVDFTAVGEYFCTFAMTAAVMDSLGGVASSALEGNAVSDFAGSSTETLGEWVGEIQACMTGIIITCFCAFVIGLVFLVILRFAIGCCVYSAICGVWIMFIAAGALCYVRSGQCSGVGLLESGQNTATAAQTAGETVAAASADSGSLSLSAFDSEACSGTGCSGYRGVQDETQSGKTCVAWADQNINTTLKTTTMVAAYDLQENYCRNPMHGFYTIWCYTTDPTVLWETCLPIGVLQPECPDGYEVEGETARSVIMWCGVILLICSLLWILAVWCFMSRIRLAIAINKVAAQFVYNTPQILVVPLVQVVIGIVWCLLWSLCAMFLISQVPDDRTPKTAYVSYAEAYGSYDAEGTWTVGACIGDWPVGQVWKDEDSCVVDETTGEAACWKCFPPRFVFDYRFAYIFFSFLWTNALMIAAGQFIIAAAVGIWFFTKHSEKSSVYKVGKAVKWFFRYHFGSAAFGAFILAVVQFIRYLMMYFEQQAKVQKNKLMEILLKVGQCVIACLERCIKFLNKNAYIQVALKGTNFCRSAMNAFSLIVRNIIRFGIVAGLSFITERIGIMCITIATTTLGYLIVKAMHPDSNPVVPCILFIFVGYIVAKLYMAVFLMAVDCSLQCFIMVEESGGEPGNDDDKFVPGPLIGICPADGGSKDNGTD